MKHGALFPQRQTHSARHGFKSAGVDKEHLGLVC
jgi:hypothetical protein